MSKIMFDYTLPESFPETSPIPAMQPIHETLFILAKCHRNIQLNWEAIEKYQENSALISLYLFTYNLSYYNLLEIAGTQLRDLIGILKGNRIVQMLPFSIS